MLVFEERGKPEYPEKKPLGAKERTNNKLNPHMASTPGFEPGPHWWEASALTTAPPLLPNGGEIHNDMLSLRLQVVGYMQSLVGDLNNKFTWSSFPLAAHESSRGSYVVSGLMKPLSDSPEF